MQAQNVIHVPRTRQTTTPCRCGDRAKHKFFTVQKGFICVGALTGMKNSCNTLHASVLEAALCHIKYLQTGAAVEAPRVIRRGSGLRD